MVGMLGGKPQIQARISFHRIGGTLRKERYLSYHLVQFPSFIKGELNWGVEWVDQGHGTSSPLFSSCTAFSATCTADISAALGVLLYSGAEAVLERLDHLQATTAGKESKQVKN